MTCLISLKVQPEPSMPISTTPLPIRQSAPAYRGHSERKSSPASTFAFSASPRCPSAAFPIRRLAPWKLGHPQDHGHPPREMAATLTDNRPIYFHFQSYRMGQYFKAVNLDKKEYVCPWRLSGGAKLWEWSANAQGSIFTLLLRKSSEGGGGDFYNYRKGYG